MQANEIIMYTVKDIQNIFKCSLPFAYKLVKTNGFPAVKFGGKTMVEKGALGHWIEKNKGKQILMA